MTHLLLGLFKESRQAGKAIAELKKSVKAEDISLVFKHPKTGKVSIHQVQEALEPGEMTEAKKGAKVGGIAGMIGGISTIVHPALFGLGAVGAMVAALGVAGASVGELVGGLIGAENEEALPPERAAMYKNRIHTGEVLVAVTTEHDQATKLRPIFSRHGATEIRTMHTKE